VSVAWEGCRDCDLVRATKRKRGEFLFDLFVVSIRFAIRQLELLVNNELGSVWKEVVVTILRYAPGTFLEGLRETAITFV